MRCFFCKKKFENSHAPIGSGQLIFTHPLQEHHVLFCFKCAFDPEVRQLASVQRKICQDIATLRQRVRRRAAFLYKNEKLALFCHLIQQQTQFEAGLLKIIAPFLPVEIESTVEHDTITPMVRALLRRKFPHENLPKK